MFIIKSVCVGALLSPERPERQQPLSTAVMQGRFRTAFQQAQDVCRQVQAQQQVANSAAQRAAAAYGRQQAQVQPPRQPQQPPPADQQRQQDGVVPPGGFMRLLMSQGSQEPAPPATVGPPVRDWRNVDMSEVYQTAYARQLADNLRQQQEQQRQQQLQHQQAQQMQLQQLCNFITAGLQGTTPAPLRPAAPATSSGEYFIV